MKPAPAPRPGSKAEMRKQIEDAMARTAALPIKKLPPKRPKLRSGRNWLRGREGAAHGVYKGRRRFVLG
jgi:hypothetical protein